MLSEVDTHIDTHTYRHTNQSNFKKPGTCRPLASMHLVKKVMWPSKTATKVAKVYPAVTPQANKYKVNQE